MKLPNILKTTIRDLHLFLQWPTNQEPIRVDVGFFLGGGGNGHIENIYEYIICCIKQT